MKGPQRKEKGDNTVSESSGCTEQGPAEGRRRATIKRAGVEAILIKGPQREENGDNKRSGGRGYAEEGPAEEENGDNKESGRGGYGYS